MSEAAAGLVDSFFTWSISTDDGVTFTKVESLLQLSVISREKVTDDVTTTDAHNTHSYSRLH